MVDEFLKQFASKEAIERHELKKAEIKRKLDELDEMVRYYKEERKLVKRGFMIQLTSVILFTIAVFGVIAFLY